MKTLKDMQEAAVSAIGGEVNPKELLRLELLTSFEKYTKCMFYSQYHRSFIVAEHHKRIFDALQDVVDGKCKRLIINAGITTVIIRDDDENFRAIDVEEEWVKNDDSLGDELGY